MVRAMATKQSGEDQSARLRVGIIAGSTRPSRQSKTVAEWVYADPIPSQSQLVETFDAFVLVTPEYNHSTSAALKNALDHLYREWAGKPAMIVTYGGRGGDKCAEQLRQVCEGLHMAPIATRPGLIISRERIEANSGEIDPAAEFGGHLGELRQAFAELADARRQP